MRFFAALFFFFPVLAFASEKGAKNGLPQFDPTWFSSKIFWLAVTFSFLYLFFSRKILPDLSLTIENRRQQIQSDMETAKKLSREAQHVQESYERGLQKARIDAKEAVLSIETENNLAVENWQNTFRLRVEKDIENTGKTIRLKKKAMLKDIESSLAQLAADIVERVAVFKLSSKETQRFVQHVSDKEGD